MDLIYLSMSWFVVEFISKKSSNYGKYTDATINRNTGGWPTRGPVGGPGCEKQATENNIKRAPEYKFIHEDSKLCFYFFKTIFLC